MAALRWSGWWSVLALLVVVAGCGGGDDDDDPRSNARLESLVVDQATLMPEFDEDETSYTAEVANAVATTTVTPTTERPAATVTVNGTEVGSGTASPPIDLAVGENVVSVVVTSEDGTNQVTYSVAVTRRPPPSTNASLDSLRLTVGDLDQIFDPGVSSYTASVGFFGSSTAVVAEPEDDGATLTLDGEPHPLGEPGDHVPLDEGANDLELEVTAEDGIATETYTVEITRSGPTAAGQEAYVKASNTGPDEFGTSIALSGDVLAAGAPDEGSAATGVDGDGDDNSFEDAGAAYVFHRAGGTWSEAAYVKASNTGDPDRFGTAVGVDGELLAVGAPGEGSLDGGIGGDELDNSGEDVGAVYLFERDGMGVWDQVAYLKAAVPDSNDAFGGVTAVSRGRVIVGATGEDSAAAGVDGDAGDDTLISAGAAYLFTRDDDGDWLQEAYLKASNPDSDDFFGSAVALSGHLAAVGAPLEDSRATGVDGDDTDDGLSAAGAVYLFELDDDEEAWQQGAYVKASNTDSGDEFGTSIALDGDLLAVGAPGEDGSAAGIGGDETDDTLSASGAVYVFERDDDGDWAQSAYVKASNPGALDGFGNAVALRGNLLVVGARSENSSATGIGGEEDDNDALDSGAVYVFERDATGIWNQIAYLKASNSDPGDELGAAVAVDGDSIAAGAPFERSADTGIGGDESDDTVVDAGAVYVFR